jgi:hypothetical protein
MLIKQLKSNKTDFENQGFNGSMANNDFTICSLLSSNIILAGGPVI